MNKKMLAFNDYTKVIGKLEKCNALDYSRKLVLGLLKITHNLDKKSTL